MILQALKNRIGSMSGRSAQATRHIAISLLAKGVGILCSLLVVPMTIKYVNPSQYGIWLAISSIVGWIAFFDLGLANGFRNKFAQATNSPGNMFRPPILHSAASSAFYFRSSSSPIISLTGLPSCMSIRD